MPTTWTIAETPGEIGCAQRVRYVCFHDQLGIAIRFDPSLGLDVSGRDNRESVDHILVFKDSKVVGTARVGLYDAELAAWTGSRFSFEAEGVFDLAPLLAFRDEIAEIAKVCVLREAQAGQAPLCLYAGLLAACRAHDVSRLVGLVDCATAVGDDAERMREALEARELVSAELQVRPRRDLVEDPAGTPAGASFYAERDHGSLDVAPALESFITNLGARCIGKPVRHPVYPRFVMPMMVRVDEIPQRTISMIERAARPLRAPSAIRAPRPHVANDVSPRRRNTQ
jgi:L-ornithine Nalpha-acyltransferase